MKLSIVVPVYNAQEVLAHTIDSVLSQNWTDIELILVNDGSTDRSGEICRNYAEKEPRIRLVEQENAGVSAARNAGIRAASGDYITFVDADDAVLPEMYTEMLGAMDRADAQLAVCGVAEQTQSGAPLGCTTHAEGVFEGKTAIGTETVSLLQEHLMHSMSNKVYCLSLLRTHKLLVDTSTDLGEDLLFNLQYLRTIERMVFLEPCYFLYIHPDAGSSVTRYRPGKFAMMQKLYRETAAFAHDMGCPEDSRRQARFLFVKWTWSCYFDLYHPSCPLRAKARTLAIQETLETEELQYCAANCRLQGRMDQILAGAIVKKRILRIKLLARGIRFVKIRLGGLYSRMQNKRTNA